MIIDWHFPSATEDSEYKIEIKGKNSEWYQIMDECDGKDDWIASNDFCRINARTLLRNPFNLLYNDKVFSRVYKLPEYGISLEVAFGSDETAPITWVTPDYVSEEYLFGDLEADWSDMWLDIE